MMEPYANNLNYTLSMIGEEGAGVEVDDIFNIKDCNRFKKRKKCVPSHKGNKPEAMLLIIADSLIRTTGGSIFVMYIIYVCDAYDKYVVHSSRTR